MLWAEQWNYTALIFTSSAGWMFSVILALWWTSPQVNWSVALALLGVFFCPELLQYVVQKLCPFLCHLGIPKCWLNRQLPTYSRCKIFLHQSSRKKEFNWKQEFYGFYLFVLANIDGVVQLRLCFGKNKPNFLGYIQATFILQIFWVGVFLSLGPDYLTTFQQNSQFGLSLIWRLAQKSCLFLSFGWVQLAKLYLYLLKTGSRREL